MLSFDPEADAAYIRFSGTGVHLKTSQLSKDVLVDIRDDSLAGIEILNPDITIRELMETLQTSSTDFVRRP